MKTQFSADKGENDCSCLFEACPGNWYLSGWNWLPPLFCWSAATISEAYVYGKSDGSIANADSPYGNQGSCRIKNEYRSSWRDRRFLWMQVLCAITVEFGIRRRNVTLDGEGYFKVAEKCRVPFFVKTNDVQVQVVGAVFNVRAYDDDNYVMVSLLEGRVNLSASTNSVMKLFPNEQALYNKNTGRMEKSWIMQK